MRVHPRSLPKVFQFDIKKWRSLFSPRCLLPTRKRLPSGLMFRTAVVALARIGRGNAESFLRRRATSREKGGQFKGDAAQREPDLAGAARPVGGSSTGRAETAGARGRRPVPVLPVAGRQLARRARHSPI